MQTTTAKTARPREPSSFTKRIGGTTYKVAVHFSDTSKETVSDKILRLVKSEAQDRKAAGQ